MGAKLNVTVCIVAGLAAMVSTLPAQPILKRFAGDSFQTEAARAISVSGTIWNGQVVGIQGFGPVQYSVNPFRALKGEALMRFSTRNRGITVTGAAEPGRLSDVKFTGKVWTFSNVDPRLAGLSGDFNAEIDSLKFDAANLSAGCISASGRADTNVLSANRAQWSWAGPGLEGPISCEGGAPVMTLSGGDVSLIFKAMPDGRYESRASVQSDDPAAQTVMTVFGFTQNGNRFSLIETGRWQ